MAVMVVRTVANMFVTAPSTFDIREHFDYNIASLTGIPICKTPDFSQLFRKAKGMKFVHKFQEHACMNV